MIFVTNAVCMRKYNCACSNRFVAAINHPDHQSCSCNCNVFGRCSVRIMAVTLAPLTEVRVDFIRLSRKIPGQYLD
jgi:hypothetical protein